MKNFEKRRLVLAKNPWRKYDSLIRKLINENLVGTRLLGRPSVKEGRLRKNRCKADGTDKSLDENSRIQMGGCQYVCLAVQS